MLTIALVVLNVRLVNDPSVMHDHGRGYLEMS